MDRSPAPAIALSLLSFPFLLPHVLEDFQLGMAQRVGLSTAAGAALLGALLAVQILGLVRAGQGSRGGLLITAAAGAVWAAGALLDHGPEIYRRGIEFRSGLASVVWALGLLVTQALASALAIAHLFRQWRR